MKASKQTLIVCWIITIISLLGIVILHTEIDIIIQEQITKTTWFYNDDTRTFYQGIWSNVFTGAIVSVFMTYVSYKQAKHDLEFQLNANEQIMILHFTSIASNMYSINLTNTLFKESNYAAIRRFEKTIEDIGLRYERMIEAANDYSPFFINEKTRNLMLGKKFLQELWIDICSVEDSLLIYTEDEDIKKVIDSTRQKVEGKRKALDYIAESIKNY